MSGMESLTLEQKQKRVAYALNMCTVSVSQIIDYDDIVVLEQEYNAILNNLNLEQIPKDEALLKILKDLLDVITHFKISETEKEFVEKEYQQKMKDAIWSAVPNFAMVLASGKLIPMAVSLANQVGIGYMNYRRNKSEYSLDRDKKMWQLKKAAIEQFNYIRKELFDSSWRLAETYNFPDEYRLTERQIKEYNRILEDHDVRRRYERLDEIKEYFEAYPPFWYFYGNAANLIANDKTITITESARTDFRQRAVEYFEKFEGIEQNSLLREDVLSASCALEHVDLLLLLTPDSYDSGKVNDLIRRAAKMSGNDYDVLQLCAVSYLKIGRMDEAARVLRRLVNADYNTTINAQMLSSIYVRFSDKYRADYELLADRVGAEYLFPMPSHVNADIKLLEADFEAKQKQIVRVELEKTIKNYLQKYTVRWNKILSSFEEKEYADEYFFDNPKAREKRRSEAERVFGTYDLKQKYWDKLGSSSYELDILELLNDLFNNLFKLSIFNNTSLQVDAEKSVREKISKNKDVFRRTHRSISEKKFQLADYIIADDIMLKSIVGEALENLLCAACQIIKDADSNKVSQIESEIINFCRQNGIDMPTVSASERDAADNIYFGTDLFGNEIIQVSGGDGPGEHSSRNPIVVQAPESDRFGTDLFGHEAVVAKKNAELLKEMSTFIKGSVDGIELYNAHKVELLTIGDPKFNGYFQDDAFSQGGKIKPKALLVVHEIGKRDHDLIFTTDGLIDVKGGKANYLTPYKEVKRWKDSIRLFKGEYKNDSLDLLALYDLIQQLGERFTKNVEDKVEHISTELTSDLLLKWFEERPATMSDKAVRIVALPTKENLLHFGYAVSEGLDTKHNLLQCCYSEDDDSVIAMRIIRFEKVSSSLQSVIIDNNGILKINL